MSPSTAPVGDSLPGDAYVISVRVGQLRQLFSSIDPSPFRERDLDPKAEEFIVGWAADLPRDGTLSLVLHLDGLPGPADDAVRAGEAVRQYFASRMVTAQRDLRELFRRGRFSLVIALVFLAVSMTAGDVLASSFPDNRYLEMVGEGLLIAGWVAMWRPLEVFLYDWWPVRARVRLLERLAAMPLRIQYDDTRRA